MRDTRLLGVAHLFSVIFLSHCAVSVSPPARILPPQPNVTPLVPLREPFAWEALRILRGNKTLTIDDIRRLVTEAVPGKDYPVASSVPANLAFSCYDVDVPGYYVDVSDASRCQIYHHCSPDGKQQSFICPNGTLFNQITLVCDLFFNIQDCKASANFYNYSYCNDTGRGGEFIVTPPAVTVTAVPVTTAAPVTRIVTRPTPRIEIATGPTQLPWWLRTTSQRPTIATPAPVVTAGSVTQPVITLAPVTRPRPTPRIEIATGPTQLPWWLRTTSQRPTIATPAPVITPTPVTQPVITPAPVTRPPVTPRIEIPTGPTQLPWWLRTTSQRPTIATPASVVTPAPVTRPPVTRPTPRVEIATGPTEQPWWLRTTARLIVVPIVTTTTTTAAPVPVTTTTTTATTTAAPIPTTTRYPWWLDRVTTSRPPIVVTRPVTRPTTTTEEVTPSNKIIETTTTTERPTTTRWDTWEWTGIPGRTTTPAPTLRWDIEEFTQRTTPTSITVASPAPTTTTTARPIIVMTVATTPAPAPIPVIPPINPDWRWRLFFVCDDAVRQLNCQQIDVPAYAMRPEGRAGIMQELYSLNPANGNKVFLNQNQANTLLNPKTA